MPLHIIKRNRSSIKETGDNERALAFAAHLGAEIDETFLREMEDKASDPVTTMSATIVILCSALGRVIAAASDYNVEAKTRKMAHQTLDTMIDEAVDAGGGGPETKQ